MLSHMNANKQLNTALKKQVIARTYLGLKRSNRIDANKLPTKSPIKTQEFKYPVLLLPSPIHILQLLDDI